MNRVLSYDRFKLHKSKFWWICILISMAIADLTIFTFAAGASKLGAKVIPFSYYRTVTNPSTLIFLIIVCMFIGTDFKTGTIKNVASKGIKRHEIVLSKLIWSYILAIVFVALTVATALATMIIFTKTSIKSSELIEILKLSGLSILSLWAFSSIYTLITFIVKSSGAAIAISIILSIFSTIIITLVEQLILKSKNISRLFPNFIATIASGASTAKSTTIFIIAMFVWIIVCSALTILIFQKQDIK